MTGPAVPLTRPLLGATELAAVQEPLRSGWLVQGPRVAAFEQTFAAHCGAEHAVATSSCTTALHLTLHALGAGPGDEVLVPAFTWIATANAVVQTGATPVFCDVRLEDFNVDPSALAAAAGRRTVGIVAVHQFGAAADMPAIQALAGRRGLWVLEDAACAFGTRLGAAHAGTFGRAGCFSFHPRKAITTGEGGMVVTADAELAARLRRLRDHGAVRSDHARHTSAGGHAMAAFSEPGFNYRMTDLQGALGCAQMERADQILAERAERAERYGRALAGWPPLQPPAPRPGTTHGWQSYVCLLDGDVDRTALMIALEADGIATRPGTHAPPATGAYGEPPERHPVAARAERCTLALPLFAGMTDAEQDRVIEALERHL